MKRTIPTLSLAAALCACGHTQSPEVETPAAQAPEPAPAPEPVAEPDPAPAPAPDPEAEKAAKEAAQREAEFAAMEAEAQKENERWTDELHAQAKALAEKKYPSTAVALKAILPSAHRMPGNAERDAQRHPKETLAFLGLKPTMTVFEYGPGAGWYTEILAPLLAAKGKLIVNNGDPNGPREDRGTFYAKRLQLFLDKAPELYGKVEQVRLDPQSQSLGMDGKLDMALIIRGAHNLVQRDQFTPLLDSIHAALKPGGTLAIIEHRAKEGADPAASAKTGYLPQAWVIEQVEAAGFKLAGKSEVNANPKDTTEHPSGVWTLPPTLRLGDTDKDKYLAIGESDRMTLKFKKVKKKAPVEKPAETNTGAKKKEGAEAAPAHAADAKTGAKAKEEAKPAAPREAAKPAEAGGAKTKEAAEK